MAKQKGITQVSGKLNGVVGVISPTNGNILRKAPTPGPITSEAFRAQSVLTGPISRLSGSIRQATEQYAKKFKSAKFVKRMNKLFRVPKSAERYLMISQLRDFEVNEAYPFSRFWFQHNIEVTKEETELTVRLIVKSHVEYKMDFNTYYLQFVVLFWNTENNDIAHDQKKTHWIYRKDELPLGGDLHFPLPENVSDYLVMCRIDTAVNKKNFGLLPEQGMKVVCTGSYSERSLQLLADYTAAKKQEEADRHAEHQRPAVEEERVEMKKLIV